MSTQNELNRILEIIHEIIERSANGDYIYRGEPEDYGKVSSSLWREIVKELSKQGIDIPIINTKFVQTEMRSAVQNYANETAGESEFEIMGELQHYGGKTNLIDFTTDYLRALFFACNGSPDEDGRVILLQRNEEIDKKYNIEKPQSPINRVIAQKSIFVQPPDGFIDFQDICDRVLTIPKDLKQWILQHLRKYHDISTETIYNDLHGFIKNQSLHHRSYIDLYIGLSHLSRDDYDLAIAGFDRALDLNPNFAEAYNVRGFANLQKEDYNLAIADYIRTIELNPNYSAAYNNRGIAYRNQGEVDRAIDDYTRAIELNPNYAEAYNNRGNAHSNFGNYNSAITDCTRAIALDPNLTEAYHNRAIAYREIGDNERAIADCSRAIDLNPNYVNAYSTRGFIYGQKGDYERAIADCNRAIELNSNNFNAYIVRGFIYGQRGDYERAIVDYTKTIELNPDSAAAYHNRSEAWLHLEEWEKARLDLITAKEKGVNIINEFRNDYESVDAFEEKYDIQLPADIAEMLTATQS